MKAKDILQALNKIDPEADVNFRIGSNVTYRRFLAALICENEDGDEDACLANLDISIVSITDYVSLPVTDVVITLQQSYFKEEYFNERMKEYVEKGCKL